ncbi:MAG: hypothetical protein KME55_33765 [Nostoc indistinguendum CM1-VF10]|jgi:hypothetical protein|nr:hypothetical protein [Nostoc indistinguendum CM1-VF10]
MNENKDFLKVVGDFLIRFYHEEPNVTKASTKAIKAMTGLFDYELEVSNAFKQTLESSLNKNTLRDLVRLKANRYAQTDEDAREFLNFVYKDNDLDKVVDFKELRDEIE